VNKFFKFFEYAYLAIAVFFLFKAYEDWGQEQNRSYLYIGCAVVAVFMYFFKKKFRKRIEMNNKNR